MTKEEIQEQTRAWKDTLHIADIARGEGIAVRKSGRGFACVCPLHQDTKPSLSIDADGKLFYCHGCNRGGDAITFIMELRGLTFKEALIYLNCPVQADDPRVKAALNQILAENRRLKQAEQRYDRWRRQYTLYLESILESAKEILAGPPMSPHELDSLWQIFHIIPESQNTLAGMWTDETAMEIYKNRLTANDPVTMKLRAGKSIYDLAMEAV